jgi:hypothetical protein
VGLAIGMTAHDNPCVVDGQALLVHDVARDGQIGAGSTADDCQ